MKSLQEGYKEGRKKGWCKCDKCGLECNFADKDIIKSHITGKGCNQFRILFGFPKGYKLKGGSK